MSPIGFDNSIIEVPNAAWHQHGRQLKCTPACIPQDMKERSQHEERSNEDEQRVQERKIVEQEQELRQQEEQARAVLDLQQTPQVLELQVTAV
jgi:hypothetical protein